VRLGESICMTCWVPDALFALRVKLRTANRIQVSCVFFNIKTNQQSNLHRTISKDGIILITIKHAMSVSVEQNCLYLTFKPYLSRDVYNVLP